MLGAEPWTDPGKEGAPKSPVLGWQKARGALLQRQMQDLQITLEMVPGRSQLVREPLGAWGSTQLEHPQPQGGPPDARALQAPCAEPSTQHTALSPASRGGGGVSVAPIPTLAPGGTPGASGSPEGSEQPPSLWLRTDISSLSLTLFLFSPLLQIMSLPLQHLFTGAERSHC